MEMGPRKSPTQVRVEEALYNMSFDEMDLPEMPTSVEWASDSYLDEENEDDSVVDMNDVLAAIKESNYFNTRAK